MTAKTFTQINALAMALPYGEISNRIQTMCAEAAENAATIGGEPMAHLECSLCFCEDHDVCKWFTENNVAF